MKIVQINAVYGFASTGRTTKELHEYLLSNNIDSYVFCATSLKIERNVYLMGGRTEHKIHSFLAHSLGLEGYFSSISTLSAILNFALRLRGFCCCSSSLGTMTLLLMARKGASVLPKKSCLTFPSALPAFM